MLQSLLLVLKTHQEAFPAWQDALNLGPCVGSGPVSVAGCELRQPAFPGLSHQEEGRTALGTCVSGPLNTEWKSPFFPLSFFVPPNAQQPEPPFCRPCGVCLERLAGADRPYSDFGGCFHVCQGRTQAASPQAQSQPL